MAAPYVSTHTGAVIDGAVTDLAALVAAGGLGKSIALQDTFGVSFAATSDAAGMTSELLDDYEEGTFTPLMQFAAGSGTITYTLQQGVYTKVGRLVSIAGRIITSSIASRTGAANMANMPYPAGATYGYSASIGQAGGFNITAGCSVTGYMAASSPLLFLYLWDATAGTSSLIDTEWTDDGGFFFQCNYMA